MSQTQMKTKSISRTVLVVGALILSVLIGQAIFSTQGTMDIQSRVEKIRDKIYPTLHFASKFKQKFDAGQRNLDKAFNPDIELLEDDIQEYDSLTQEGLHILSQMDKLSPDSLLTEIKQLYAKWQPAGLQLLKNKLAEQEEEEEEVLANISIPNVSGISENINSYVEAREKDVTNEFEIIIDHALNSLYIIAAIFVFLLLFITGFIRFTNGIALSLRRLSNDANAIKDGDLERQITKDRDDEIGNLQVNFDSMRIEIKDYIENLDQKVQERTQEVNEEKKKIATLLNNMRQAVFKVNSDLTILGPISDYSKTVFKQDIEGLNLMDVLYKDLDPKSEEHANLQSAFISIFGEGELQWDLSVDHLTPKITRWTDKLEKQSLSINYAPLWDFKFELEEIMLVIEDITEVERLAEEKKYQEESINIIQELSTSNLDDIKGFFEGSLHLVRETQASHNRLLNQGEIDLDTASVIYRHLHTLKGNARVFGLTLISSVVHAVESDVNGLVLLIKSKETIPKDLHDEIHQGLINTHQTLDKYAQIASTIFKIESGFKSNVGKDLLDSSTQFDKYIIQHIETSSFTKEPIIKVSGQRLINNLNDAVLIFKDKDLVKTSTRLIECFHQWIDLPEEETKQFLIKRHIEFRNEVRRVFHDHPNSINHDSDGLSKFASTLFQISTQSTIRTTGIKALAENLSSLSRIKRFQVLSQFSETLEQSRSNNNQSKIDLIWTYLRLVFQLDLKTFLNKDEASHLSSLLKEKKYHYLEMQINNSLHKEHFSFKWMRQVFNDKIDLDTFFQLLSGQEDHTFKVFEIDHINFKEMLETLSSLQFNSLNLDKFDHLEGLDTYSELNILLTQTQNNSLLSTIIDLQSLLYGFTNLNDVNQSSELYTTKVNSNNLKQLADKAANIPTLEVKKEIEHLIKKLEEPDLKSSFYRYSTMISKLSNEFEKLVSLEVLGDFVSVDSNSFQLIHDSIIHLIRNSLDHAIETPDERIVLNKPERGNIAIEVLNLGTEIQIKFLDDGQGIDTQTLFEKAQSENLIEKAIQFNELSEDEKHNLIFTPNLSSKVEVNQISGRGVGMDVVKKNIEHLGGKLTLNSQPSKGTHFIITLPQGGRNEN